MRKSVQARKNAHGVFRQSNTIQCLEAIRRDDRAKNLYSLYEVITFSGYATQPRTDSGFRSRNPKTFNAHILANCSLSESTFISAPVNGIMDQEHDEIILEITRSPRTVITKENGFTADKGSTVITFDQVIEDFRNYEFLMTSPTAPKDDRSIYVWTPHHCYREYIKG